jgi:hypothetical protein
MTKPRTMKAVRHAARVGKTRNECKVLVEKPEDKRSLRKHVDGRIILKYTLREEDGRVWSGYI